MAKINSVDLLDLLIVVACVVVVLLITAAITIHNVTLRMYPDPCPAEIERERSR